MAKWDERGWKKYIWKSLSLTLCSSTGTNNHNGWIYIWPSLSGLLPLTSGEQTKQIIVPADDLGRQLEEIVAEHENDMVRIDEKVSKHAQNIAKLENDFLAASEKQAKVNEVVDERLQRLELMIPPSPAPNERAPLRTRKYLKQ